MRPHEALLVEPCTGTSPKVWHVKLTQFPTGYAGAPTASFVCMIWSSCVDTAISNDIACFKKQILNVESPTVKINCLLEE